MKVKLEEYVKEYLDPIIRFIDLSEKKQRRNLALMQSRKKHKGGK